MAGEGRAPTTAHLVRVAEQLDLKRAPAILDEVRRAVARFETFAERGGVPARLRKTVAGRLRTKL